MSEQLTQAVERMAAIREELERLDSIEQLTTEDGERFDALGAEWQDLNTRRAGLERAELLESVRKAPEAAYTGTQVTRGDGAPLDSDPIADPESTRKDSFRYDNPWDLDELRTFGRSAESISQELRARALSAVERLTGSNDERRKTMTDFVENHDDSGNYIARLALLTSSPAYLRAFEDDR